MQLSLAELLGGQDRQQGSLPSACSWERKKRRLGTTRREPLPPTGGEFEFPPPDITETDREALSVDPPCCREQETLGNILLRINLQPQEVHSNEGKQALDFYEFVKRITRNSRNENPATELREL